MAEDALAVVAAAEGMLIVAGEAMLAGAEEAETMVLEGGVMMPVPVTGVISADEAEVISTGAGAEEAGILEAEVISMEAGAVISEAGPEAAGIPETGAWICPSPIWLTIALGAGALEAGMAAEEVILAEGKGVSIAAEEEEGIIDEDGIGAGISDEDSMMMMISEEDI